MTRVVMYGTTVCPYYVAVERLLKQRGVEQIEKILINREPRKRGEVMMHTNRHTVPQIYTDERHIDSFDDLSALDREGSLAPLPAA